MDRKSFTEEKNKYVGLDGLPMVWSSCGKKITGWVEKLGLGAVLSCESIRRKTGLHCLEGFSP